MKRRLRGLLRRWLAIRFRRFKPGAQPTHLVRVDGLRLRVDRSVFDPRLHFTSAYLARFLRRAGVIQPDTSVLDLGTGSGIAAIASARAGARRVVATDINPAAVRSTRHNIAMHGLSGKVAVREGDMFEPVRDQSFDIIISNPPYLRGIASNVAERAYMGGSGLEWFDCFILEAPQHLSHDGRVLMVLGDAAEIDTILSRFRDAGWQVRVAARRDLVVEVLYIYELQPQLEGKRGQV